MPKSSKLKICIVCCLANKPKNASCKHDKRTFLPFMPQQLHQPKLDENQIDSLALIIRAFIKAKKDTGEALVPIA